MRIKELRIRNVLGLKELAINKAGNLVEIHGRNGSGKTSILEAIALAFGGKRSDPTLLREGAEKGEVYVLLDDGTEIRRPVTSKGAGNATVKDPRFKTKIRSPESRLKELLGAWNPIHFLELKGRDRVQYLLEAMPVSTSRESVLEVVQVDEEKVPEGDYTLERLDELYSALYEERRNAGVALRRSKATVEEVETTLPEEEPRANGSAEELRETIQDLEGDRRTEIDEALEAERQAIDDAKYEAQKAMDELERYYQERKRAITEERARLTEKAQGTAREKVGKIEAEYTGLIDPVRQKLGHAEERERERERIEGQRQLLERLARETEELETDHAKLDQSCGGLLELKRELLEDLPIDGVEFRDGELFVEDSHGEVVHFDRLNTANRIRFAVRLAALQAGELRTILVDGLERMDSEFRKQFLEEAQKTDIQHFVAIADDSELHVEGGA